MVSMQQQIVTSTSITDKAPIKSVDSFFSYMPKKDEKKNPVVAIMDHPVIGEYKVVKTPDYKGILRTYYSKSVGTNSYQCTTLESLVGSVINHKDFDNSGAEEWGKNNGNI
jgi:hypothetical protein